MYSCPTQYTNVFVMVMHIPTSRVFICLYFLTESDVFRADGRGPGEGGTADTEIPPVSMVELKRGLLKSAEKMLTNLRDALMESTTQGTLDIGGQCNV